MFVYASFNTRRDAETALEDMFATGAVRESERPTIERRMNHKCMVTYFAILLPLS